MKKIIAVMLSFISAAVVVVGAEIRVAPAESVENALSRVKEYRQSHPGEKIRLIFSKGVYFLPETICVTPELNDLCITAAGDGEVVFSGGEILKYRETVLLNGRQALVYDVPEAAVCDGHLDQLYINGRRAVVASTPKDFDHATHPEKMLPEREKYTEDFFYKEGDFDPSWHDLGGIEAHAVTAWIDPRASVSQCFPAEKRIRFDKPLLRRSGPEQMFVVWRNVREALTEPGEYYFDRAAKTVSYLPRDGETPETIEAVAPVRSLLFLAAGDEASGKKVSGIVLDGIAFRYGGVGRPDYDDVYRFPGSEKLPLLHNEFCRRGKPTQGAIYDPAVVSFHFAENCKVLNCRVEKSDFYAIGALAGITDMEISGNDISDMGAGGILVNGVDLERAPQCAALLSERITVSGNHVHDCGKFDMAGVGIMIGFSRGNLVEHNLIHDLFYSGISAGWNWGHAPATGGENRIGFNHIYNIGRGMLSDMAGIYLLGIQPGTRVYNNHIHHVSGRVYGGWALYADEGSSHQIWERNVCYDTKNDAFHQNFGRENTLRDNVFAFCGENLVRVSNCEASDHTGYRFPGKNYSCDFVMYRNILIADGKPFFRASYLENFDKNELFCDCNLYFDLKLSEKESIIACKLKRANTALPGAETVIHDNLEAWRQKGHDLGSVFTDPGFVDAKKRDFHLKPDAAARKLGFFDPAETLDFAGLTPTEKNE
ncbi:MAG: right-handed parallel beta-helix repeat-containing protein [Victivallaceae bacterium]|nr:right-handed parallel beta-helix repeat-containing protein [Victivallaceae bacterium]